MESYKKRELEEKERQLNDAQTRYASTISADSHAPHVVEKHTSASGKEIVTLEKDTKKHCVKTSHSWCK